MRGRPGPASRARCRPRYRGLQVEWSRKLRVEQLPHPPKPVIATVARSVIEAHWSGGGAETLTFTILTVASTPPAPRGSRPDGRIGTPSR